MQARAAAKRFALHLGKALFTGEADLLAPEEFLDCLSIAGRMRLVAGYDHLVSKIYVSELFYCARPVLPENEIDVLPVEMLSNLFHIIRVARQTPPGINLGMLLEIAFNGQVLHELLFKVVEGRFAVKETGFEGPADIMAVLVERAIEQAAVLVKFASWLPRVCFDVVKA
jgi:hypothetical protein